MSFVDWELENFPQNFGKLRCSEVIDRQTLTHVICNMDSPEGVERDVFARVMSEVAKTLDKVPFCEIEQQTGWISVKDRMPDEDAAYMVFYHEWSNGEFLPKYDERYVEIIKFFRGLGWIFSVCVDKRCENDTNREVTHWMPLPKPPKEVDHEDH